MTISNLGFFFLQLTLLVIHCRGKSGQRTPRARTYRQKGNPGPGGLLLGLFLMADSARTASTGMAAGSVTWALPHQAPTRSGEAVR